MLFQALLISVSALTVLGTSTITTAPHAKRTALAAHHKRAPSSTATGPLPLTAYNYPYGEVPYQVNPYPPATAGGRGPQTGYNICNSTTEGPTSDCQTLVVNSLSDFCLWGSPLPNGITGNIEGETVAFCTQPGHGTRLIPSGALQGVQFIRTSAYIQVTGRIKNSGINLEASDAGGELDPHGADLLGNPLGGLVYSTALPGGSNNTYIQSQSWNNFIGSDEFCFKVCFPSITRPNYCENRYDIIGCRYNAPASYKENEYTSCDGELQDVVGTYVSGGQTLTWDQNSGGDPPYQPRTPATSNCRTFASSELYPAASSTSVAASSVTTGSAGSGTASRSTTIRTGSSSAASATNTASNSAGFRKVANGNAGAGILAFAAVFVLSL